MLSRRLQRLAALTQGLALVGVGACNSDSPAHEPPHINSPYIAPDAAATPESTATADTATDAAVVPVTVNSPPTINAPFAPDAGYRPPHTINAPPKGWKPAPAPSEKP